MTEKIKLPEMPLEVIIKIITLLPINDRKSLRTTAKNFKTTIDLHNLWLNEILNKTRDYHNSKKNFI